MCCCCLGAPAVARFWGSSLQKLAFYGTAFGAAIAYHLYASSGPTVGPYGRPESRTKKTAAKKAVVEDDDDDDDE